MSSCPSRKELANAIRILSIDAIQHANSGHPGTPMGMADIAEVLWREYINHNPQNPNWVNRDRFILSNGHGSMLLYSLLHLTGYDISINDLKRFRQLYSKTPGHPEYNQYGTEATTGPLGQGFANAVGMAIAEKTLAAQFNKGEHIIVDHYTYVFTGDGCMMEGISHEVSSLAGILKLGKLITFYDNNGISIDGKINGWFADDTAQRFKSYGWHVIDCVNGHNIESISNAIKEAKAINNKPSLIICNTIIGYGSPNKSGSSEIHGSPLGIKEVIETRKALDWHYPPFIIPKKIYLQWDAKNVGKTKENIWINNFSQYARFFPKLAKEFMRRHTNQLPKGWEEKSTQFIKKLQQNKDNISGRQASQKIIEIIAKIIPEFLGGSADLTPSNLTKWSGSKSINEYADGNYIHYGVREFGMTAIANGISLHKGFIPYTATFLIFIEYARNAVRMASLMKIRQILIYTHDSIGIGEDGPTHQPVEQIASLRLTPNMITWRPCDQVECAVAWKYAIERYDGPTALILSRQMLAQQFRSQKELMNIKRGGYILYDCLKKPDLILIATGSEIQLAKAAYDKLISKGYKIRLVSMPSTELFDQQDDLYREMVLPKEVIKRVAIEASISDFWYKYIGLNGEIIGMKEFGESAPAEKIFSLFGFCVDNIINTVIKLL
ncbi:MAG: transketolase [Candidatus Dasytiphilus stammeri]